MKQNSLARLTTALVLVAIAGASLAAQIAPAPTAAAQAAVKEEAVLLSPFEVRTDNDNGYTAASALAGGRTDTPIKLTSAALSVMTSQFLDDIGSTNFRTAGEWSLNWVPQIDANTGVAGGFQINYRNMGATFASRNYFLWYVESDSYNTERYEFARGPNGVLFGDGGPGGISTTWTKRPRFDRATNSVNVRLDSYDGWRSSIDLNRPITKKFALRLNAFAENAPNYRDYNHNERQGVHLAGAYRLTNKSQLRFEGEFGLQDRSIFASYYTDQASYWNGTAIYNGVTAPSTNGTGVTRISTSNFFVYIPGTANNGLNDWGPSYQTTGTGFGLLQNGDARTDLPNSPKLPRKEFNLQPPDSVARLYYYAYTGYFEHRFSDNFFAEVAFNRFRNDRHSHGSQNLFSTYRIDVNSFLPGTTTPNPNFGKPFTDTERTKTLQGNIVSDVRALFNYRIENHWINQSLSVIIGSRDDRFDTWSRTLRRVNGTNPNLTNAANQIRERRYWDQANVPLGAYPSIPGVALDYIPNSYSHQKKVLDYSQLASTSRFFRDRLAVMVGIRRDAVSNAQSTTSGIPVDPVTGLPRIGAVLLSPAGVPVPTLGAVSRGKFAPVSRNAGAVWFVLPWLGVFGNYSETFAAPNSGNNLIDGTTPPISKSKGKDAGFKFELLGGKITATASYYTSEQQGLLITGSNITEINRIGTNLNRPEVASLAFRDTQDQKGSGYEFEVTANPVRNLRLTGNLALPKTSAVNLQPGLIGYFNANVASWTAAAPGSLNPTSVNNDINTIRNTITSLAPGTTLNNTFEYTGNLYATYSFSEGKLKNVSVGAGGNFRGKSKVASSLTNAYDYRYADPYTIVSAHATYRHRLFNKYTLRYQLNVANVLDSDKAIYNGYGTYRVSNLGTNPLIQVPNNIRMPDPRKFTLQTSMEF
ncbi:MAG: TonB-dependent receptor [Verrucomicrobia bacterium]|nr:TonB-dependent receptor [Verrucomicrobiota bacterium]